MGERKPVPTFDGVVQDAGGGMVSLWVYRETEYYPREGEHIRIYNRRAAYALEAENARLRTALDATTTLLSAILSTTELSEEHPEEAEAYPDMLAPRNRDQFKHVLDQAIDVLGPPSDA